jgi:hypothetical protein
MLYTLYLYKSHPYRDRISIRHEKLIEYVYDEDNFEFVIKYSNINFNPNDGITTEVTVGKSTDEDDAMRASYLLVTSLPDPEAPRVINSRWFIMEQRKIRRGQWRLTLRRDIVAENYNNCLKSTFYIEKAMLPIDNKLICNSEGSIMNKVKKQEILLNDKTGCAWIVGYYAKNTPDEKLKGTVSINNADESGVFETLSTPISSWKFYKYGNGTEAISSKPIALTASTNAVVTLDGKDDPKSSAFVGGDLDVSSMTMRWRTSFNPHIEAKPASVLRLRLDESKFDQSTYGDTLSGKFDLDGLLGVLFELYKFEKEFDELLSYNGKTIKDSAGKYYRITVFKDSDFEYKNEKDWVYPNTLSDEKLIAFYSQWMTSCGIFKEIPTNENARSYYLKCTAKQAHIGIQEVPGKSVNYDLSGKRLITQDAGYNIFAIPYPISESDVRIVVSDRDDPAPTVSTSFTMTKDMAMAMAQSMATNMGTYLYDIQLLPYCPITDGISLYNYRFSDVAPITQYLRINWTKVSSTEGALCKYAKKSEVAALENPNAGIVLCCPYSNASFDISSEYFTRMAGLATTALQRKVSNECDLYRLVSPNYQGTFEFNLSKNDMSVDSFHVDCKYKPYSPYIHVAPDFKGLYGTDYDDARGLTCSGDFSLDVVSDAWIQYQINNKNYENVFNRQIEYLDFNRGQERITQAFSLAAGAIQGTSTGALTGVMVGGPIGAAVGATVGGISSIAGGLADWAMAEERYQQQRSYNSDMYQYRLGNVQALPYSLSKVSSFSPNSKYVPFIEIYSCTDEEKEAFEEKIKFNSMSVGAIGLLGNYIQSERTFFKGQMIRYGGIDLDDHEAEELAKEFNMGVYI